MSAKAIAFYLPQFHPVAENNRWWGEGFTEWANVAAARPRFRGHRQPQLPADLGFYDLRVPEVRAAQAAMARNHAVDAFCYYHYWFAGKRLLQLPLDEVLSTGAPDFPFCLCWANETWSRAWDGREHEILIKQEYSEPDHDLHIQWLLDVFQDRRYLQVDDRPVFAIYRPDAIPDLDKVLRRWRAAARSRGFSGLYLIGVRSGFSVQSDEDVLRLGFDSLLDFQPNRASFGNAVGGMGQIYEVVRRLLPDNIYQALKLRASANKIVDYDSFVEGRLRARWPTEYRKFPCVFPSWDNSARRKSALIIQNDRPEIYERWLRHAVGCVSSYPKSEQLVFINAWNEWAEGCHLEPDVAMGHRYLQSTRAALQSASK